MASSTHPDIVEFMTLYQEILTTTKGRLNRIPFLYENNAKFAKQCRRIDWLAFILGYRVRDSGDTVVEHVDSKVIAKLRRYENELGTYIGTLTAQDLLQEIGLVDAADRATESIDPDPDAALKEDAKSEFSAIETRLELGSYDRLSDGIDDEVAQEVYDGEKSLRRLLSSLGLNGKKLVGALYRHKKLIPVHIPTHVSFKKTEHAITLSQALKEAHRAYILGSPLAAIALCRCVSEVLIRDHYKIGDPNSKKFLKRFQEAETDPNAKLRGADTQLTELVKYGSDILHGRWDKDRLSDQIGVDALPSDTATVNRVVFLWLRKLQRLIEEA